MKRSARLCVVIAIVCAFLFASARPADAQGVIGPIGSSLTKSEVIAGAIVTGAVAIGLGFAIYFLVRTPPTITGCAVAGPGGVSLQNEGNHKVFLLIGDVASIKVGDRIKVKGKSQKKDATGNRSFLVSQLKQDYGPCNSTAILPTTPSPATR